MLASSQHVDLTSQELVGTYCCLLPSWSKTDIFSLGNLIHGFEPDEMETRFYLSGGSVRYFTMDFLDDVRRRIGNAVGIRDMLLSSKSSILSGKSRFEHLRRTLVDSAEEKDQFMYSRYWEHVIDSEYALRSLCWRLNSDDLHRIYTWARGAGYEYASLAGSILRLYIHSLATEDRLRLRIFKYDPPTATTPDRPPLDMKRRERVAVRSGTANGYERSLSECKKNPFTSYWLPDCDDFPNIDGIAKIQSVSGKKESNVAYLQIVDGQNDTISEAGLKILNKMFFPDDVNQAGDTEPPIYIALCSSLAACEEFVLTPSPEVAAALSACPDQVYVGYYEQVHFTTNWT